MTHALLEDAIRAEFRRAVYAVHNMPEVFVEVITGVSAHLALLYAQGHAHDLQLGELKYFCPEISCAVQRNQFDGIFPARIDVDEMYGIWIRHNSCGKFLRGFIGVYAYVMGVHKHLRTNGCAECVYKCVMHMSVYVFAL